MKKMQKCKIHVAKKQKRQRPGNISVVVPQRYMLFCLHVYSLELYGFLTDVGQGRTALAVGADGFCLAISLLSVISLFCLPLSVRRPDID